MVQEYEIYYRNEKGIPVKDIPKFNVLITTFEIIIADCMELREFNWRLCVIDEAHRLKNRNCKLLEGLRLLNLVSWYWQSQMCEHPTYCMLNSALNSQLVYYVVRQSDEFEALVQISVWTSLKINYAEMMRSLIY